MDEARELEIKQLVAQCRVLLESFEATLDKIDEEGKHRAPMVMMDNNHLWKRWFSNLLREIHHVVMARPNWVSENAMQAIRDVIEFQLREGFSTMRRATGKPDEGDR
jgi:hypothetical protein